ncbi:MAG: ankyrin repeat domain-containing protein, partial [Planctomycetota bacterium]
MKGEEFLQLAERGDWRQVELELHREPTLIGARDPEGRTALHYAAIYGHADLADELLRLGAEPNVGTSSGLTPLHLACENNRPTVVDVLLAGGAEANIPTRDGDAPLHVAAASGQAEIVRTLL